MNLRRIIEGKGEVYFEQNKDLYMDDKGKVIQLSKGSNFPKCKEMIIGCKYNTNVGIFYIIVDASNGNTYLKKQKQYSESVKNFIIKNLNIK